jgi:hypothetical protein
MNHTDERLVIMAIGWIAAFYGVCRRDWPGSVIALAGISVAGGALVVRES